MRIYITQVDILHRVGCSPDKTSLHALSMMTSRPVLRTCLPVHTLLNLSLLGTKNVNVQEGPTLVLARRDSFLQHLGL